MFLERYCKVGVIGTHTKKAPKNIGTYFEYKSYVKFISKHTKYASHVPGEPLLNKQEQITGLTFECNS